MNNYNNNRIKELSLTLANQIAAGEVIERPASVIKELVENSIDAGANQITIKVSQAGTGEIIINDNGCGIYQEDLELAFKRHATSKINTLEDFESLTSFGFRGEALASIASVSNLEITSKPLSQKNAYSAFGEDGKVTTKLASHPDGTTIKVASLFYNTPVRKKYLKTPKTELSNIELVVKQMALANFSASFKIFYNDKLSLDLPKATSDIAKEKRIIKLVGKNFIDNSITIDTNCAGMRLKGFIGAKDYFRASADLQFFYVNNRIVKDRLISHAIKSAYHNYQIPGRYPAFILFLEIDPQALDVNVHPTKHEIRFLDSRYVHDFMCKSLIGAINSDVMPEITNEPNCTLVNTTKYEPANTTDVLLATKANTIKSLGIVKNKILLIENETGIICVNLYKYLYSKFVKKFTHEFNENKINSRPLLWPKELHLASSLMNILEKKNDILIKLGFSYTITGTNNILLRRVVNEFDTTDVMEIFTKTIKDVAKDKPDFAAIIENLAKFCASSNISSAIKPESIIDELSDILVADNISSYNFIKQLNFTELE